jgi:fibronectin type 3 domain-containing protein
MASQVAWGAPVQSSVCTTFQNDLVAFDAAVNADSAVRAADAAYTKAKANATRAYNVDKAAYIALAKAKATKNKSKIAKALATYRKAHANRIAAGRIVAATKARADYVRAITWQQLKSVVDAACIQPPSNLAAVATNGDVSLTWTGPTDVAGYRVYRNGVLVATVTAQTFSFDDTNVKNGTTYNYMVRSFVFDAESQDSNIVTATPMLPAPQDLNATPGDTRVALSWSSVAGATSYQVWRDGAQNTTRTSTSYTDTAVTNGTTYTYTVRAVAGNSVSGDSDSVDATPVGAVVTAPSAPTNLVATGAVGRINLTWTAATGATGYKILRGGTQIGTSTTTSYADTTAIPGTTYSYTVVATNGTLSSSASAASSASSTPAPPTNFTATAGDTTVSLSWTAATGATGYQVFRNGAQIAAPTTTSYTDATVTNGQTYTYTVRTVVGSLVSADSTAKTVTPNKAAVLAAPTGVAAGTATSLATGAFRLTWTAVTGATSYSVYSDGALLGTSTTTSYTPATAPAFSASHAYTVMATNGNAALNSPLSTPVTAAVYQGPAVNDANGRTVYGQIQTYIVVTIAATKTITGCWATYPTTSDSGQINPAAIPTLCSQTLTAQPTSANATTVITNASGASFTSPAFKSSLQQALVLAGM